MLVLPAMIVSFINVVTSMIYILFTIIFVHMIMITVILFILTTAIPINITISVTNYYYCLYCTYLSSCIIVILFIFMYVM